MMPGDPIKSDRLLLRALSAADATEAYAGWLCDPEVNRFLDTKSATVRELVEYIELKNASRDALFFGIFLVSGEHIGTAKLEPVEREAKRSGVALLIGDKRYWGRGFGAEAMRALIGYAFGALGLEELYLGVNAGNSAAVRLYERLGFIREEDAEKEKRELSDSLYGLVRPDTLGDVIMRLCRIEYEKRARATA